MSIDDLKKWYKLKLLGMDDLKKWYSNYWYLFTNTPSGDLQQELWEEFTPYQHYFNDNKEDIGMSRLDCIRAEVNRVNLLDELKEWYKKDNTEFHSKIFDDYVDSLRFVPYPRHFVDSLGNAKCVLEFKEDEDMRFKKVKKGFNTDGMRLFGVKDKKEDCSVFDELFMDEKKADKLTHWLNENVESKKSFDGAVKEMIEELWKCYDVNVTKFEDEWIVIELENTPITLYKIKKELSDFPKSEVSYERITCERAIYRIKEV